MGDPPVRRLRRGRFGTSRTLWCDLLPHVPPDGEIDGRVQGSLVNKLPRPLACVFRLHRVEKFCAEWHGVGYGYHLVGEMIGERAVELGYRCWVLDVAEMVRYEWRTSVE